MTIGSQIGGGDEESVGLEELTRHFAAEAMDDYRCEHYNNRADLPPLPAQPEPRQSPCRPTTR